MTLGLVLTPYGYVRGAYPFEINKSGPSEGEQLCPADPYYFQRGEYGFFYDTPFGGTGLGNPFRFLSPRYWQARKALKGLGAIPTDAEIGQYYYSWYTPVQSAWVYAKDPNRYIPGPWVPPHNVSEIGPFGPMTSLRGLGTVETAMDKAVAAAPVEEVIRLLEKHHRDQFTLSALAAAGTVAASAFAIYRTIQGIREDKKKPSEQTAIAGHHRRRQR